MPFRILIADDSASARKILKDILKTHGHHVCGEAENGLEAVKMTLSLAPDMVVLDLVMPELDGMGAAQQISRALPDTPIILHTLDVLPQIELEAKKQGVSCVISKACTTHILSLIETLKR